MVKTNIKPTILRRQKINRTERQKLKNKLYKKKMIRIRKRFIKKSQSIMDFDANYFYQERILFLLQDEETALNGFRDSEESEFIENKMFFQTTIKKYRKEDRLLALISLKDILEKISKTNPSLIFPDNFFSSVITLLDNYLIKSEKFLKKEDMFSALFSCCDIIDKEQSICVFSDPYFQSKFTYEITKDILKVVNLNFYPVKVYDYFDIFYFQITQNKNNDFEYLELLNIFKKTFMECMFYMLFHDDSKMEKPSINFISCLLFTYEASVNIFPKKDNFIPLFINIYKKLFGYDDCKYKNFKIMIKESINIYENIFHNIVKKISKIEKN